MKCIVSRVKEIVNQIMTMFHFLTYLFAIWELANSIHLASHYPVSLLLQGCLAMLQWYYYCR